MMYGMYAIKDAKSTYMAPTADLNDACAIRNFEHAVRQPNSLLASHPNDYSLFKVGTFDNVSGCFTLIEPPKVLCDAAQCLQEV